MSTLKRKEEMDPLLQANVKRQATAEEALIKFCVPANVVGSVIGKGGDNVTEFMKQSQTKIHVSRQNEMFPGTRDRICTISATSPQGMNSVLVGLHLILSKIVSEDTFQHFQFKLIMPSQECGAIIGKGGTNIKSIMQETGCQMKVSDHNQMPFRLLTIMGTIDQQLKAVALCFDLLVKNSTDYMHHIKDFHGVDATHIATPLHPSQFNTPSFHLTDAESAPLPGLPQVTASMVTVCVVKMPGELVGGVIGKGGSVVTSIMSQTGTHIKISEKVPGASVPRTVTIKGSEDR
uniref:K Homology domain-containing protein n=2 Tax=Chloropicon primus TaxID=1764295 RepID=A0A7S2T6T1_9CHLO|mmetsp:Transcript_9404/g.26767  ORF Transcript_9404/g.26767 Transcript_9404/m.26767 type:complete len:291 (+) Transcript_9404:263-1135(+)